MKKWMKGVCWGLFAYYLLILVWIIVFKMHFSLSGLDRFRGVNLVPLGASALVNGRVDWTEIANNALIFFPFGVYLRMLRSKWPFWARLCIIAGAGLLLEALQYALCVGASDMTDWLAYLLGGGAGMGAYALLLQPCKTEERTNRLFFFLALCFTLLATALLALLLLVNA